MIRRRVRGEGQDQNHRRSWERNLEQEGDWRPSPWRVLMRRVERANPNFGDGFRRSMQPRVCWCERVVSFKGAGGVLLGYATRLSAPRVVWHPNGSLVCTYLISNMSSAAALGVTQILKPSTYHPTYSVYTCSTVGDDPPSPAAIRVFSGQCTHTGVTARDSQSRLPCPFSRYWNRQRKSGSGTCMEHTMLSQGQEKPFQVEVWPVEYSSPPLMLACLESKGGKREWCLGSSSPLAVIN